jgi:alcohol dehydrogenase (cytochrome c)
MVMENLIIVGNAAGDAGTRGWLQAVDFETGERVWRFYTVPGPGEFGHETWADEAGVAWMTGGASIWTSGSYDVEQRLFIQGTAQPVPMFDPEYRPGDNLFSNSAIALHIDTGELAWYFQYTPNESWDYDEQGIHMLVDSPFDGVDRQQVVHFGRNGYFYQLDRTSGEFITAAQYVEQITWTAGLDEKTGLPIEYDPNLDLQIYIPETRWVRGDYTGAGDEIKVACPQLPGGVRWQTPALNPDKFIAYVSGEDGCQLQARLPSITLPNGEIDEQGRNVPGGQIPGGAPSVTDYNGLLAAVDLSTGELIRREHQPYDGRAGVLATAGGLIFTSWGDGSIVAYNDETLDEVWRFYTGMGVEAPISSFEIDGKQYLAAFAGDDQVGNAPGEAGWGAVMFLFTID